jgi:hypothetical protein
MCRKYVNNPVRKDDFEIPPITIAHDLYMKCKVVGQYKGGLATHVAGHVIWRGMVKMFAFVNDICCSEAVMTAEEPYQ